MNYRPKKGFTLVEIIVSVFIISIVSLIIFYLMIYTQRIDSSQQRLQFFSDKLERLFVVLRKDVRSASELSVASQGMILELSIVNIEQDSFLNNKSVTYNSEVNSITRYYESQLSHKFKFCNVVPSGSSARMSFDDTTGSGVLFEVEVVKENGELWFTQEEHISSR